MFELAVTFVLGMLEKAGCQKVHGFGQMRPNPAYPAFVWHTLHPGPIMMVIGPVGKSGKPEVPLSILTTPRHTFMLT
jgi:hypothetical protein